MDEDKFFSDYNGKPESLNYLEATAETLDRFISSVSGLLTNQDFSENERYDLELMCDLSGTMMVQLLNMIKGRRGDYEFFDDVSQMNENGEYEN